MDNPMTPRLVELVRATKLVCSILESSGHTFTDAEFDKLHRAALKAERFADALLQANEVKRLSNPVDDGAVERALDAYYEVQGELHVHEDDNKRRMRAALEAVEPHP